MVAMPRLIEGSLRFRIRGRVWRACLSAGAVAAHRVETDRAILCRGHDCCSSSSSGQVSDCVEPGGEAVQFDVRGVLVERVDECLAPTGIRRAHLAQVPVEATGLDQRCQRELVQAGRAAVIALLVLDDRLEQVRRADDPPKPQRGRERLADGPDHRHSMRGEALECANRFAVVAELGVVVVLDDRPVMGVGPLDQCLAPSGASTTPSATGALA